MEGFSVTVPVEVSDNWLCDCCEIEPDDDDETRAKYTSRFQASLRCGCSYVGEKRYGYGNTPEEAVADLAKKLSV